MLQFQVLDEDGLAADWLGRNAHLRGADGKAIRGQVDIENNRIICRYQGNQSVALSLRYPAGSVGEMMLQTCLLPQRQEPYVLSVELARHRTKLFIAKSEVWQMFDLSQEHPAMELWEEARVLFTKALTIDNVQDANRCALRSLHRAVQATERLSMTHAEVLLHRRYGSQPVSSTSFGTSVSPDRDGKGLRDLVASSVGVLAIPIRWRDIEPEPGQQDWSSIDRWISWAQEINMPLLAGPLLDFSPENLPDWMVEFQSDYDECRNRVYDYAEGVVSRYGGAVNMWNLASGINIHETFTFSASQVFDLIRTVRLLVRQVQSTARTMVEIRQPFGEHCATDSASIDPLSFVHQLAQEGITIDAVGVQLLFGQHEKGRTVRDLMQISDLLDHYHVLETPLIISAAGLPSREIDPHGGHWHGSYTDEVQARWISRLVGLALSKPTVESIIWVDLFDHDQAILPEAGLVTSGGDLKPAFTQWRGIRKRFSRPLGPLTLPQKSDHSLAHVPGEANK